MNYSTLGARAVYDRIDKEDGSIDEHPLAGRGGGGDHDRCRGIVKYRFGHS